MYAGGLGAPVNTPEALRLFERAAGGGEFFAMVELGRAYANGSGVDVNRELACKWYRAALAEDENLDGCDEELREARAYVTASGCKTQDQDPEDPDRG